jgi:hypothetical protein
MAIVVLMLYPARLETKGRILAFLLCAILSMWTIAGAMGWFYLPTLNNPLAGILAWSGVPILLTALVSWVWTKMRRSTKADHKGGARE